MFNQLNVSRVLNNGKGDRSSHSVLALFFLLIATVASLLSATPSYAQTATPTGVGSGNIGAVIIVGGRLRLGDSLQSNIHNVTDNVYHLSRLANLSDNQINYFATDLSLTCVDAI